MAWAGCGVSFSADILDPQTEADRIGAELEKSIGRNDKDFCKYRKALISSDPVASFMRLYQVLMSYHHDDMKATDDYIHMQLPQLEYGLTDRYSRGEKTGIREIESKPETVYTRLRNEVGHNRPQATSVSTQKEMQDHLGGLMSLVKKCIEDLTP